MSVQLTTCTSSLMPVFSSYFLANAFQNAAVWSLEYSAATILIDFTASPDVGSARVADLVASTSLTRPTVTQALAALERAGWAEMGPGEPPRKMAVRRIGRPAQQVRFRSEAGHVLGIDIGRHKLLAAV